MNYPLILIIMGCLTGCAGGVIGTYCSIRNTNSKRERIFVIKASIIIWIAMIIFIALLWLLPSPYRFLMWIPYIILLPVVINVWNKRQAKIREEERASSQNMED